MRNFRLEVGLIVFHRRYVRAVIELGLDAEGVEVLQRTLDFPSLGIGERLTVFDVVRAFRFDDEVILLFIVGLDSFALEDEAEVRLVKVADRRGDTVALGSLRKQTTSSSPSAALVKERSIELP